MSIWASCLGSPTSHKAFACRAVELFRLAILVTAEVDVAEILFDLPRCQACRRGSERWQRARSPAQCFVVPAKHGQREQLADQRLGCLVAAAPRPKMLPRLVPDGSSEAGRSPSSWSAMPRVQAATAGRSGPRRLPPAAAAPPRPQWHGRVRCSHRHQSSPSAPKHARKQRWRPGAPCCCSNGSNVIDFCTRLLAVPGWGPWGHAQTLLHPSHFVSTNSGTEISRPGRVMRSR